MTRTWLLIFKVWFTESWQLMISIVVISDTKLLRFVFISQATESNFNVQCILFYSPEFCKFFFWLTQLLQSGHHVKFQSLKRQVTYVPCVSSDAFCYLFIILINVVLKARPWPWDQIVWPWRGMDNFWHHPETKEINSSYNDKLIIIIYM